MNINVNVIPENQNNKNGNVLDTNNFITVQTHITEWFLIILKNVLTLPYLIAQLLIIELKRMSIIQSLVIKISDFLLIWIKIFLNTAKMYGPLARYMKLRVVHVPGMSGTFSPPLRMSDPWRTCRGACRDRKLAVSFEVSGGENVPGIPGACTTRNFTYLAWGLWHGMLGYYIL